MNQRVNELAVQAGLIKPYGSDHEGLANFDYRKFAELIVKECCSIIEKEGMNMTPGYLMRLTVPIEIQIIKEHFGVS
jgi:hypothetical protein